eukprot:6528413-Alexandrium_andersonii.AAC.1
MTANSQAIRRGDIRQSAIRAIRCSWGARSQNCKIALGVRNLNCAVPGTTSTSTPEAVVRGVRRRFAR